MENNEREFHDAVIDHKEPVCPICVQCSITALII